MILALPTAFALTVTYYALTQRLHAEDLTPDE